VASHGGFKRSFQLVIVRYNISYEKKLFLHKWCYTKSKSSSQYIHLGSLSSRHRKKYIYDRGFHCRCVTSLFENGHRCTHVQSPMQVIYPSNNRSSTPKPQLECSTPRVEASIDQRDRNTYTVEHGCKLKQD
jgi:hypothetical protein